MTRQTAASVDTRPMTRLLKALADEGRLRIIALLAHCDLCVCHVEEALRLSQPAASRQLAVLRNAGVVESRRQGSWVHYSLAKQRDPDCQRLLREVVRGFSKRKPLKRDLERLVKARGPKACA